MRKHKPKFIDRELLARITACIAERGLTPTKFGEQAINDPDLVRELGEGREMRRATRERVEAFMSATTGDAA